MSEILNFTWDSAYIYHVITKPSRAPLIMTAWSATWMCMFFYSLALGYLVSKFFFISLPSSFIFNSTYQASFVSKALFAFKIAF